MKQNNVRTKSFLGRFSKSSLAICLALLLMLGTMVTAMSAVVEHVGLIRENDMDLAESGDTTYYLHIGVNSDFRTSSGTAFTYDSTNSIYYASYELTANSEYPMVINTTSGSLGDGNKSSSSQTVTSLASSYNPDTIQFDYFYYSSNNYDGYDCFKLKTQTTQTVYFTFDLTSKKLVVYSSLPSGGGGGESSSAGTTTATTASKGTIPTRVLAGTDVMIYIESYDGSNIDLCNDNNSSPSAPPSNASDKDDTTANKTFYSSTNITDGKSYVQVTKTSLSTYNRITNNLSDKWYGQGNQSANISAVSDTNGGQLFYDKVDNGNAGATTCTTTIAPLSIEQGDTVTFTTTCGDTTMSYADHDLYYQYYLDDSTSPIEVASGKDSIQGSTSSQDFTLSSSFTSTLSTGSHTLKTVATDGCIYYISDTDTFTVTAPTYYSVTVTTSSSAYGYAEASPASAVAGATVTLTAHERSGSFTGWTVVSGGATLDDDAASTTFVMPDSNVTIRADFEAYSATSDWYYNGYSTSDMRGTSDTDGYAMPMTAAKVNGTEFSYYYVEARTGSNQLFTVSYKSPAHPYGGYDYIYFHGTKSDDDNSQWAKNHNIYCWFESSDGVTIKAYSIMEYAGWSEGYKMWRAHVPYGAKKVYFKDNNNGCQMGPKDLTTETDRTLMCYWANGSSDGLYNIAGFSNPVPYGFNEYFYNMDSVYYNTTGHSFSSYNVSIGGGSHAIPNPSNASAPGYYVMVLYPGNTYTVNGDTVSVPNGSTPYVVYTSELPSDDVDTNTASVYAKDGAIRTESYGVTYANIADTTIYSDANHTTEVGTPHSGQISGQNYMTYKAEKGQKLYIRTIINNVAGTGADTTANNVKYYVRGFCVNGVVSAINSGTSAGTAVTGGTAYDLTYEVPEDYAGDKIEITPIYYLADTTSNPIVTFRVTDFPMNKYNWGDTLYAYPFYGAMGSNNNAFGAYPGQPLVYYKGQYQVQIPQKSTAWDPYLSDAALSGTDAEKIAQIADTAVSGVTMSNGYFDLVHRIVMGYGGNGASSDHVQTYDYDDFYKIFNEKSPVDNIVFDFKYESAKDNRETLGSTANYTKSTLESTYGTGGNGFEFLTNFHGNNVDLFGNPLFGNAADPEQTTPVYVISIAGPDGSTCVENIAGYYATEWAVFTSSDGTNYTRMSAGGKSSIPPSVLVLNDENSFDTDEYPSAVSGSAITDWEDLYTALKDYQGHPVYITYESAQLQVGSQNSAKTGGGGATRNDGRWLYSKTGESITSNIKIQVSQDNGVTYYDNGDSNLTYPSGETEISGLSAYFTNSEVYGETTYSTTIDPTQNFNFEAATSNASYMFVGWYMSNNNNTLITTDNDGSTERSGSYTLLARFKQVTDGQLVLTHNVAQGTFGGTEYLGSGSAAMSVTVKNANNETVATYTDKNTVTLDKKIISTNNSDYTVYVTLDATPTGYDSYQITTLTTNTAAETQEFNSMPQNSISFTVGSLFSGNNQITTSKLYKSYFHQMKFSYNIDFAIATRVDGNKNYNRQGTLNAGQVSDYVNAGTPPTLDGDFISTLKPYESQFARTITWPTFNDVAFTISNGDYVLNATYTATVSNNLGLTATFCFPYAHSNGVPIVTDGKVLEADSENLPISVNYGSVIKNNGSYITAASTLYDNAEDVEADYFQYWRIETTSHIEVARCYSIDFNYLAYEGYLITPVYGETISVTSQAPVAAVSYLGTTRNQYNGTGVTTTDASYARDLLFNDFVLSYGYHGMRFDEHVSDLEAEGVQIGYVVDRVQKMEQKQDGTYDTSVARYAYKDDDAKTARETTIKTLITSNNTTSGTLTQYALALDSLDNKNRMENYYAVYNSKGWDKDSQSADTKYAYKNYVYRVYSYIVVDGEVTLSETPVYFTMYDEAVK